MVDLLNYNIWTKLLHPLYYHTLKDCFLTEPSRLRYIFKSRKDSMHTLYFQETPALPRKQLFVANDNHVMFWLCVKGSPTPNALHKKFCNDVYGSVWTCVQRFVYRTAFWNDCTSENSSFFVWRMQIFTDKTATYLHSNSIVSPSVHVALLQFKEVFHQSLFDDGY